MTNWVASTAYRTLHRFDRYTNYYQKDLPANFFSNGIIFEKDEQLVGVYENIPGNLEDSIVITDKNLHLFTKDKWLTIRFGDVTKVDTIGEKFLKSGLTLYLTDGQTFDIPVTGGKGSFTDKFEFLRFFQGIMRRKNLLKTT
ncbi:MAG: hypothetical protein J0I20_10945 [Chloroflexi bacterium]|nr:hypothetical protein [Chloroflexota bacterium]